MAGKVAWCCLVFDKVAGEYQVEVLGGSETMAKRRLEVVAATAMPHMCVLTGEDSPFDGAPIGTIISHCTSVAWSICFR